MITTTLRETINRNTNKFFIVILLLGFSLRLALVIITPTNQIPSPRCGGCTDEFRYNSFALTLLAEQRYEFGGEITAINPPLYALFVAAIYALAGAENFLAVWLAQVFTGTATIIFVGLIAKNIFNYRVGLLAALFTAINPFLIFYTAEILTETLFAFLVALSIYLCLQVPKVEHRAWAWALGAGAAIGLATLCRSTGFVLLGAWAIWLLFTYPRKLIILGATGLAGMLIVLSPWILRNYLVFERFIPFSTNGFSNIVGYYVNDYGFDITSVGAPAPPNVQYGSPYGYLTEMELDTYTRSIFFAYCSQHPIDCANAWQHSFFRMLSPFLDPLFHSSSIRLVALVAYLPLLILGTVGFYHALRGGSKKAALFFIIWFFLFMALNAIKRPEIRYRIPGVDPYLGIFSAAALIYLADRS